MIFQENYNQIAVLKFQILENFLCDLSVCQNVSEFVHIFFPYDDLGIKRGTGAHKIYKNTVEYLFVSQYIVMLHIPNPKPTYRHLKYK